MPVTGTRIMTAHVVADACRFWDAFASRLVSQPHPCAPSHPWLKAPSVFLALFANLAFLAFLAVKSRLFFPSRDAVTTRVNIDPNSLLPP